MKVKVTQLCPTLCNPMDHTFHGILWVRILEWVAFPFSRGSSQPRSPALQVDSLPGEPQIIYIYIYLTESLCRTLETSMTLQVNYILI